LDIYLKELFNI